MNVDGIMHDLTLLTEVVSSLRCLFGHISVRSNNAATVSMMETCLKLLKVPDYNVRMAFR